MKEPFIYFGRDLTTGAAERLALKVKPEHRAIEPELFQTKWFDYRHLSPTHATYLCASRYDEALRRTYAKTKDARTAQTLKCVLGQDVFESHELTAMWLARQAFDRIGVRYEFGIQFVVDRANDRGWRFFPRPNQLYEEAGMLDCRDAWIKLCSEILQVPVHQRFKAENFNHHPDQMALHRWLCEQCSKRKHVPAAVSRLLRENLMSEKLIAAAFGDDVLKQARRLIA